MWPDNRLQNLLDIEHPIIQAPMAGSDGLDMARAVSAAGGLGSLACAPLDAAGLRSLLGAARREIDGPLNINFFAHAQPADDDGLEAAWLDRLSPYYDDLGIAAPGALTAGSIQPFDAARCEVIEDFAPPIVSFHFGLPDEALVSRIKALGTKVLSSATTVDEARWLVAHGCDAVVAQGYEAGGHRGMFLTSDLATQMGTLSLVPQVVDAVDVPVIAAGGIADGRGVAAAFALGASGVQLGTAYLFTEEATISPVYRESLKAADTGSTALTNVFSGRPTRTLVNRMMRDLGPLNRGAPAFPKGFSAMMPLRTAAENEGLMDFSALYSGQSVPLGRESRAFEFTRNLALDAVRHMRKTRAWTQETATDSTT